MQKKKSLLAILSFVVLVFATSCKEDNQINNPTVPTGTVSGYFVTEDGTPISSATVEVTDADGELIYSGITAQDGNFTIENLPQNVENSIVSFSKDSRVLQQLRLKTLMNITGAAGKRGDVFLDEDYDYDATLLVKVIDKITQQPIENALIQLGTSENALMEFRTDSEGNATLKVIQMCFYRLVKVSKDGYIVHHNPWGLRAVWASGDIVYELEALFEPDNTTSNSINVFLIEYGFGGVPLIYRQVNIEGPNGFRDSAITAGMIQYEDSSWGGAPDYGRAIFTGLKSGVYKVFFEPEAGDYERTEVEVQLLGDKQEYVSLHPHPKPNLCSNNVLIVNFKDKNGNPINCVDGTVGISSITGRYWNSNKATISNGQAVFTNIPKGEFTFQFTGIDCNMATYKTVYLKNIRFGCNETVTKNITVSVEQEFDENCCDNTVKVRVYDATGLTPPHGEPPGLFNQRVRIVGSNGFTKTVESRLDGSGNPRPMAIFENICFGSYKIFVDSDTHTSDTVEVKVRCGNDMKFGGEGYKSYLYGRQK